MNLFFGGSLASLMRPHFYRRIGIKQLIRNQLKQNIFCKSHLYNSSDLIGRKCEVESND